jgi:transposase-like protein
VHLIRNSTTLASWKDRKELAAALKPIYQAANADLAAAALDEFEAGRGAEIPDRGGHVAAPMAAGDSVLCLSARSSNDHLHHERLLRACICASEDRQESRTLPSDEAATKLLFLALRNIEKDWKMPQRTWKLAANQFAIMFGERFTNAIN